MRYLFGFLIVLAALVLSGCEQPQAGPAQANDSDSRSTAANVVIVTRPVPPPVVVAPVPLPRVEIDGLWIAPPSRIEVDVNRHGPRYGVRYHSPGVHVDVHGRR